jgi:hypothetical protein
MKNLSILAVVFIFKVTLVSAESLTDLTVVYHYDKATSSANWDRKNDYDVPSSLLKSVSVTTPARAYHEPYPSVFLQNEYVVVCAETCSSQNNVAPSFLTSGKSEYRVDLSYGSRKEAELKKAWLRQVTVYYWINQLSKRFEDFGFSPENRLVVYVDREINDPMTGEMQTNNAFFNPLEGTLSFLPTESRKIFKGGNWLQSSYDPGVIMHETMHFFFQELLGGLAINPDMGGMNEGISDYFPLSLLNEHRIGKVMLKGGSIRDLSERRPYSPQMQVHDLGQVVASTLWEVRSLVDDVDLMDRIVYRGLKKMREMIYFSAPDFFFVIRNAAEVEFALSKQLTQWKMIEGDVKEIFEKRGLVRQNALGETLPRPVGQIKGKSYFQISYFLEYPDWMVRDYAVPRQEHVSVTWIDEQPGPEQWPGSRWVYVAADKMEGISWVQTPIWLLFSEDRSEILVALDRGLNPITAETSDTFAILQKLSENIGSMLGWEEFFQSAVGDVYFRSGVQRWLTRVKNAETRERAFSFNGKLIQGREHSAKVKPAIGAKVVGKFTGRPPVMLAPQEEIRFYTVKRSVLDSPQLPLLTQEDRLLGYEVTLIGGVRTRVLVQRANP